MERDRTQIVCLCAISPDSHLLYRQVLIYVNTYYISEVFPGIKVRRHFIFIWKSFHIYYTI